MLSFRAKLPALVTIALTTVVAIIVLVVAISWTGVISLTNTQLIPRYEFVGLTQYARLFATERFHVAFSNLFVYGACFITIALIFGFLLAIMVDQRIRLESLFRTIFLYPLSMSFIVTGLAWQWFMNPTLGLQHFVRGLGFPDFTFDWLINPDKAIYALVIAAVWQSSGLVMAILLAGLRGIDRDIWKATQIDGIPAWRTYVSIVLPMLRPMVMTCVVLLAMAVVKAYDLVVALTRGGPGNSSDLPAKFVIDLTFERANIGMASAAAVMLLVTTIVVVAPYVAYSFHKLRR